MPDTGWNIYEASIHTSEDLCQHRSIGQKLKAFNLSLHLCKPHQTAVTDRLDLPNTSGQRSVEHWRQ